MLHLLQLTSTHVTYVRSSSFSRRRPVCACLMAVKMTSSTTEYAQFRRLWDDSGGLTRVRHLSSATDYNTATPTIIRLTFLPIEAALLPSHLRAAPCPGLSRPAVISRRIYHYLNNDSRFPCRRRRHPCQLENKGDSMFRPHLPKEIV